MRLSYCLASAMLFAANPVLAAGSCTGLLAISTTASRQSDAALVKRDGKQNVSAAMIGKVLVEGRWRLVWATPKDAERGIYFFRKSAKSGYHLIDTWGGVLPPDERADGLDWVTKLKGGGPSPRLAACFVAAAIADGG
ncbi:MAG: hypothetical protein RL367_1160 [Pseudomonadota bacterium]